SLVSMLHRFPRSLLLCHAAPHRSPPFPYTTLFRSSQHLPCRSGARRPSRAAGMVGQERLTGQCVPPDRGGGTPSRAGGQVRRSRSEEHTSELQSRVDLVCRLLLEKKKKTSEHIQMR